MKELKNSLVVDKSGMLCCGGRLKNSKLPLLTQNTILIPKSCPFVHLKVKHSSIKDTIGELRNKFWIIYCRKLVTDYVSSCLTCRKIDVRPFKSQHRRTASPISNTSMLSVFKQITLAQSLLNKYMNVKTMQRCIMPISFFILAWQQEVGQHS